MNRLRALLRATLPASLSASLRAGRAKLQMAGNHYVLQRSMEDQPAWRDAASALRVLLGRGKTILFFPERPPVRFAAYEHCAFLGYTITKNPNHRFDIAFKRKNHTFCDAAVLDQVPARRADIINAGSVDISKRRVGEVFADVFGYSLDVDPVRYHGRIVEKSNANGAHDGRILQGPVDPADIRPGHVYQKEINCSSGREGFMLDYRVPVHGGRIPLVYLKYRPFKARFKDFQDTDFKAPAELFNSEELEKIIVMARKMGVDYGELDVLRDRDGRIYVVDVNNTPMTHIENLSAARRRAALECMAASFGRLLETHGKV